MAPHPLPPAPPDPPLATSLPLAASAPGDLLLNGEVPYFAAVEGCPVYAVYHPARGAAPARTAALIVPALGVEQLTGYRSEVLLARELAGRGIGCLRFHPRGQGDSAGDSEDLTLESFTADARALRAELVRLSGAARYVAVGVRLGALALAEAMAAGDTPDALVLWEPVHDPQTYFRELMRSVVFSEVARGNRSGATVDDMRATLLREGQVDVLGYPLHRALVSGATRGLETALGSWSGPTLLAQIDSRRSLAKPHAAFIEALRARGVPVDSREVRAEVSWYFLQNPAWENAELVAATADWILAHA